MNLKHIKSCSWCDGPFRYCRKYTDTDFHKVYCSTHCEAEGRADSITHLKQKEKGNAKMETV